MAGFDDATAVRPSDASAQSGDVTTYDVVLDDAWTIGADRPNGGYLLAVVGRAALAAASAAGAPQPHPVAVNAHYLTSPSTGPAVVSTEVLRTGRTASQVRARLEQGGKPCVEALFTLGTVGDAVEPWWGSVPAVELPPEEACRRLPSMLGAPEGPSLRDSIVVSFDPETLGFVDGVTTGGGELRAWFRFADDRPVDPLALLLVADALPPATFTILQTGWVPTLEITVYVRAVPAPGPLRMRFRVQVIRDGLADEVCEVWDSEGRLVAQSTQLTALRLPDPAA